MRIGNQFITGIQKLYNKKEQNAKSENCKVKAREDGVSISSEARIFSSALKAAQALPDTDQKKLEEIKARIKEDSYNVSNEDIAEKIFDEGLF